ncbi:hypothetical protein OH76DRAFT_622202 [Lentinus brumalis]|uniref:Uncharacterized protein n=1 Tax=Lentinus brumalis TaxID=2498619 RepID=A0A371D912_9APHY|nr:hypothetical protein OH76DRAFT_622202 [Polyporus brumalis]
MLPLRNGQGVSHQPRHFSMARRIDIARFPHYSTERLSLYAPSPAFSAHASGRHRFMSPACPRSSRLRTSPTISVTLSAPLATSDVLPILPAAEVRGNDLRFDAQQEPHVQAALRTRPIHPCCFTSFSRHSSTTLGHGQPQSPACPVGEDRAAGTRASAQLAWWCPRSQGPRNFKLRFGAERASQGFVRTKTVAWTGLSLADGPPGSCTYRPGFCADTPPARRRSWAKRARDAGGTRDPKSQRPL